VPKEHFSEDKLVREFEARCKEQRKPRAAKGLAASEEGDV
jgi:hypothetical protein